MAAELAKVSLWLEALESGKPLSYLDQNIRVGNSLLGVTPALLAEGLPDAAFTAIEGDDKKVATALRKQNAAERQGQHDLFSQAGIPVTNSALAKRAVSIAQTLPDSLEDLHIHQQRQAEALAASNERRIQKLLADAWCAAFVQPKTEATRSTAITHQVIENFATDDGSLTLAAAEQLVTDLTRQYRFFHWHVEFPHIFRVGGSSPQGWDGGFSCVVGNPPWERVKLQEQEFFASKNPDIANAPNAAARKKLIAALDHTDPALNREFHNELRKASGWSYFLRESGRYPLTGRGDINTYAVFAETARAVIAPRGRSGLVLPTGIATDATTAPFFSDLVRNAKLVSFLDFENEAYLLSHAVDHRVRFCLLTVCGHAARVTRADFAFSTRYMRDLPDRRFAMPPEEILLVNPNTGTTPVFCSRRDAEITIDIYKRVPVLWREDPEENPWGLTFLRMFDMANDAGLFHASGEGDVLPLYEAKMVHHFDHRLGTYEGQTEAQANMGTVPRLTPEQQDNPSFVVKPRYWVDRKEVDSRLDRRGWEKGWLLGWRDIARSTDEHTMVCCVLPRVAVGHKLPLALTHAPPHLLIANLSSFVFDYVLRQKMSGTSVSYFILKQQPVLSPSTYGDWAGWIRERVLELTYTAWDMEPFARDLGDDGPPLRWDEERRFLMRAELDALYFHLYGIPRDDVDYIMETFPIVKRKDIAAHNTYRTKDKILEIYDQMAAAKSTATDYQTRLIPPPGNGPRHPTH
jgi:hypothetical protein